MINIDITTNNTAYNTLSAQAQWVQHRFGRRDYPITDLNIKAVENVIKYNPNETINFISVFGDSSQHKNIVDIIEIVDAGKLVFNSHLNFKNDNLVEALNTKNAYVVFPCYGIDELADKILLGNDWQLVESNLKNLSCKVCVEFYLFEHNFSQLPAIKDLCSRLSLELKIKPGTFLHPDGFSTIVDQNKNWLYDAYSCTEETTKIKWVELHKTVNGYNSLIQYVKPFKGESILSNPKFYKINNNFAVEYNNISLSVTGNLFPNFDLHQIFSNALCTDWNFSFSNITGTNNISIKPEYKYLCSALTQIQKMLIFNSLLDNDYNNILTNFANSNI